ncbi:hypothetical protein, partial [Enterobacter cloacae]|uniref:hypothetical protein n=1 Tax=Enterobacter cloacae TaxID=550 RepID=UPI001F3C2A50
MLLETVNGASGRITRLRLALRAVAKATLSSLVLAINSQTLKQQHRCYLGEYGASGRITQKHSSLRRRINNTTYLRKHNQKKKKTVNGASGRITRLRLA